ncbi:MAG: ATP-dependent zinc metalloprotease FtsH [Spirochaetales bacterium]|nr:ATP-dependent zinc metalloprotease FtsH [Spirochaetales bacterium]MBP7263986.1 ATP-dependent zinc metalloprotease FtsH [Spirochaetia bacterium]
MARKSDDWKTGKLPKAPGDGPVPPPNGWRFSLGYALAAIVLISVFNWLIVSADSSVVPYSRFKELIRTDVIVRIELGANYYTGHTTPKPAPSQSLITRREESADLVYKTVPVYDPAFTALLDEKGVDYEALPQEGNAVLSFVMSWLLPIGLLFFLMRGLQKRMSGLGSNVLSIGQNKATIVAEGDVKTRFADVAGVDEAKEELVEVVDFLKNPTKYTEIGGKIPKGVLIVGAPGTGKTLLARAVAGEAGVPFFRMSGADFVEMFVGVGAARVRDLFKQAREKAPCIIFIDELDAIGKSRLSGVVGGNDEREQTLNQLLVEMDGFDATSGLIILAATNRPDVLDPALMRPGRFDRQVAVDRPDLEGRKAILSIHSKSVKLDAGVDITKVARSTPGFVGADLANVVNESALLAVRAGRKRVHQEDFERAIEKIMTGLEKKSRVMNQDERKLIAFHEAGHALTAAFTPGADPVQKVTIVPRGLGALGFTLQVPVEDRYVVTEDKLLGEIDVLLGGRAAEDLVFGRVSTGAANDITRATDIARRMITDYGMSERFKNVALTRRGAGFLGPQAEPVMTREYSEDTQRYIDETVASVIAERYERSKAVLTGRRETLDRLAAELLEKETIDEARFKELAGL